MSRNRNNPSCVGGESECNSCECSVCAIDCAKCVRDRDGAWPGNEQCLEKRKAAYDRALEFLGYTRRDEA